jgi:hypothetical protein
MSLASTHFLRSRHCGEEQPAIPALAPDPVRQVCPSLAVPVRHQLIDAGNVPLRQGTGSTAGRQGGVSQDSLPDGGGLRGQGRDGPAR